MNGICDTWCTGCYYLNRAAAPYCDYYSITLRRRPCPAGEGCTVRRRPKKFRVDKRLILAEKSVLEADKRLEKTRNRAEYDRKRRLEHKEKVLREGTFWGQGALIRTFRQTHGLTQRELAAMLGVTRTSISQWELEIFPANWKLLESVGCRKPELIGHADEL